MEYIRLEIDKEAEVLNAESDDEDGDDDGEEDEAEEFEPDLDENDILQNQNTDHLIKYVQNKQRKPSVDIFRPGTPSQRRYSCIKTLFSSFTFFNFRTTEPTQSVVIGESVNLDNRSSTQFVGDDVDLLKLFGPTSDITRRQNNKENYAS